jgi:tRNA G10  N-methylase Trm11
MAESDVALSQRMDVSCIDTSILYADLCEKYKKAERAVEVDFRAMVSWLRKGDQLTHQIHTYPAKLLPHIAHFFVHASDIYDDRRIVLDPFCGSGTVALEASLAGSVSYIADANPLATILAKVKTRQYDPFALKDCFQSICKKARQYKNAPKIDVVNSSLWYAPEKKSELERLMRAIRAIATGDLQDFFLICFSVVARKLSYADPSISVPVRLQEKPNFNETINQKIRSRLEWVKSTSVLEEFTKVCVSNIERVAETNSSLAGRREAIQVGTDARRLVCPVESDLPLPDGSVSLIVTSPPYGSAQKYVRASSLSLNWLGIAGPNELSALEGKSIGREHVPTYREVLGNDEFLSVGYRSLIERVSKRNPRRARITLKYLEEMDAVVGEMARVLAPGARAALVVGNNQVCGEPLRNDEFLIERFLSRRVKLELHLLDDIKSRGLMTKRNRTASVISRESVLVFRKEG